MFLVFYPLGVAAELLCVWDTYCHVSKMPAQEQPWTVLMPNAGNMEFRFGYGVWGMYFIYSFGFPALYSYMLAQRRKFYAPN
mmetsp:Transcript_10542/g.12484  ORF Transcript_10542/g.12484 Transcript_10542/m.12484 type:complete len:82 (+) Transcript_10542:446-691(+)